MDFFFSFDSRLNRQQWWLAYGVIVFLSLTFVSLVFQSALQKIPTLDQAPFLTDADQTAFLPDSDQSLFKKEDQHSNLNFFLAIAVFFLALWINLATTVKRFHDRNKSALWVLVLFIPYIGGFWQLIECGFLKGTEGDNDYSPASEGLGAAKMSSFKSGIDHSYTKSNNIDDVIARHVEQHEYQSSRKSSQLSSPLKKPKPVFGKR